MKTMQAEEIGATAAGTGAASSPDLFFMMVKVIFFLILIIGIFFVVMKLLEKKKQIWARGRSVKSVGGIPLGPNKSLQIVEIGRSLYVVGVGENISLLQKIDDPEEIEAITASFAPQLAGGGQWAQAVRRFAGLIKRDKEAMEDERQLAVTFQELLQQKLKDAAGRKKQVQDLLSDEKTAGPGEP